MPVEKMSISLPSALAEILRKKAEKEDRSVSTVIRLCIEAGLKKSK